MANLCVKFCGIEFKNPIIVASGTFGFGQEYLDLYPISALGGIALKGITLEKRVGNPPPRIAESYSGILNSVGLQNPGVDSFLEDDLPKIENRDTVLIANIAGKTIEEYALMARKLNGSAVDMLEVNVSCPNVKEGGISFGTVPLTVQRITRLIKAETDKPVIVKLSPNVTDIGEIARAAEQGGADAVSLINTVLGMRIDVKTRRPFIKQNYAGLSGPAVFPIALRMVNQVVNAVKIPVIGMGGISTGLDAVEMMMAGASLVMVGTALFNDPWAPIKIRNSLVEFLDKNGIKNVSELTNSVNLW